MPQILRRLPVQRLFPVNQVILPALPVDKEIRRIKLRINTAPVTFPVLCLPESLPSPVQKLPDGAFRLPVSQGRVHIDLHHLLALVKDRPQRVRRRQEPVVRRHRNAVDIRKTLRRNPHILSVIKTFPRKIFHHQHPMS